MTPNLSPQQALKQYFGFEQFRDGQEAAVQRVLNKQHTLLVMPTGSGKSLTYQLPALLQSGVTLVISPLISLMKDQVDDLVERGIAATYINSTLPGYEINQRLRAVREGDVKLLYIAPERLRNRHFTRMLANVKVDLLAVDEAHCISQWGHDFRPDYLQIGPIWQAMGRPTLLATTATATPKVQRNIVELLGVEQHQSIVTGFNRPNLTFRVQTAPDARSKLQAVQSLLKSLDGSAIIYTGTRRNADEAASFVNDLLGIPAGAYHAGLDSYQRHQTQTDFMSGRLPVVAATNAFGMGIDKADVRTVIHFNMPASIEAYYQEAGRAGRDGLPAECVLLFAPDDLRLQERLIRMDAPTYDDLNRIYTQLSRAADGGEVYFSVDELSQITGQPDIKVRVVLSELELAGAIIHLGDQNRYSQWRVLDIEANELRQRSRIIESRSQARLERLSLMLDYVHLFTCRRQYLLAYFGDVSPPRSPRCCDNHGEQAVADLPKAITPQEWLPLIVLETVRSLQSRPVGRNRLAQLLGGSRAKPIQKFGYDRHKFYGKLKALSQPQISDLIAALIQTRYLQVTGGELPVLTLSPRGAEALANRAAVPVRTPQLAGADASVDRWQQRADRSDTVKQTFDLLQQGLSVAEIARRRDLTPETIYTHAARLIRDSKVALDQAVTAEVEAEVRQAMAKAGNSQGLSRLKAMLPEHISYGQIRCVLAATADGPDEPDVEAEPEPVESLPAADPPELMPETVDGIDFDNSSGTASHVQSSNPDANSPSAIIIEAVGKLGGTLGRTGLAQLLSGSQAAWLEPFSGHSCYGRLNHLSQGAIIELVDVLIDKGRLSTSGGGRPKVTLPAQAGAGEIYKPEPPKRHSEPTPKLPAAEPQPKPVEAAQPGRAVDAALLETLRQWRTEQARIQKVPPYIIFSNNVLETIAAHRPATLDELAAIPGVGPKKLEAFGQPVLDLVAGTGGRHYPSAGDAPAAAAAEFQLKEQAAENFTPSPVARRPKTVRTAIIDVVTDLEGLITADGLALLLTAAPGEVVSFSDHRHFAAFHGQIGRDAMLNHIQEQIQSDVLRLTPQQRLVLK